MNSELNKQAQKFFRDSITSYEALLERSAASVTPAELLMTLRQLGASYLKLEAGDRTESLSKALGHTMRALSIAQSLQDEHMVADLTGKVGSCSFELGIETKSVSLIHEAISYHIESASIYSRWDSYWQQQSMHYGYAAYCIECLSDADSVPNVKRRVELYEKMLACLPTDVPRSYVEDINLRLSEAKNLYEN
jgi:hypothetical protein